MLKKISLKAWIAIASCFVAFATLMAVAGVFDLQINIALNNAGSFFGQFFGRIGKAPAWIAACAAMVIAFHQEFGKNKKQQSIWKIACGVFTWLAFSYVVLEFFDSFDVNVPFELAYVFVIGAFLAVAAILGTWNVNKDIMKKLFIFAIFLVIILAVSNGAVQVLKLIWSRQRFRTMIETTGNQAILSQYFTYQFEGFSPWFRPEFIFRTPVRTEGFVQAFRSYDSDAFASFPSGHAVAAACSFGLILLPDIFPKLKNKKVHWAFWVAPALFTFLVAFSRIVVGAHFLSDVVVSSFIALTTATLARFIIVNKFLKKEDNTSQCISLESA